jgi:hypothetical protein
LSDPNAVAVFGDAQMLHPMLHAQYGMTEQNPAGNNLPDFLHAPPSTIHHRQNKTNTPTDNPNSQFCFKNNSMRATAVADNN